MLPAMIVMLWLFAAYAAGWQRVRTTVQGRPVCAACTYDLRGVSVEAVCPECGGAERKHIFGSAWWYSPRVSCGFLMFELSMFLLPFFAPVIWWVRASMREHAPITNLWTVSPDGATVSVEWWVNAVVAETPLVVVAGLTVMAFRKTLMFPFLWRLHVSLVVVSVLVSSQWTWSVERQYIAMVLAVPLALLWLKHGQQKNGGVFADAL